MSESFEGEVSKHNESTIEEIHNNKWCKSIKLFFDDKSEDVKIFNPSYINQVIPNEYTLPDDAPTIFIFNINLHTLDMAINFPNEFWNTENSYDSKENLKHIFDEYLPIINDKNTYNNKVYITCNDFEKQMKHISNDLYSCQVSAIDNGIDNFHSRLHLLTLFFIDGASFIEYDDYRWNIFYLFKRIVSGDFILCGFCSVYHFWYFPDKLRIRISQLIILPPFQNHSYGTFFLNFILNQYRSNSNCYDITVEDPNEAFTTIIDSIDVYRLQHLAVYDPTIKNVYEIKKILKIDALNKLKITNKRFIILCEMLALYACDNDNDLEKWNQDVKLRLQSPLKIQMNRAKLVKCKYSEDIKMDIIEEVGKTLMMIPEAITLARECYSNTLLRSSKLNGIITKDNMLI